MPRVVVTGIGAVSACGIGHQSLWEGCLAGKSLVRAIPDKWREYHKFHSQIWSPLPRIDFTQFGLNRIEIVQRDPVALLALLSATEAVSHAGIALRSVNLRNNTFSLCGIDSERAGIVFGTGIGGPTSLCDDYVIHVLGHAREAIERESLNNAKFRCLAEDVKASKRINPFVVPRTMPNTISAALSIKFQLHGPSQTICQACASGTAAIGHAYRAIKSGSLDLVIAGASEYFSDRLGGLVMSFDIARTLVQNFERPELANCPYDKNRSGFVISEGGSATLVLESLEHAIENRRIPLVEIVGYAETCDAFSMMSNADDRRQAKRMIELSLKDSNITAQDISYINGHGTSTVTNDEAEASLIEELFGPGVFVNSTKGILGHSIGASGALEAVVTILSIVHQRMHPCVNLKAPIAPLKFVKNTDPQKLDTALSFSFGFGGHNSGLIMTRI